MIWWWAIAGFIIGVVVGGTVIVHKLDTRPRKPRAAKLTSYEQLIWSLYEDEVHDATQLKD